MENEFMRERKAFLNENILKHNEDAKKFADNFAKASDYPEIIKPKYLELLTIKYDFKKLISNQFNRELLVIFNHLLRFRKTFHQINLYQNDILLFEKLIDYF